MVICVLVVIAYEILKGTHRIPLVIFCLGLSLIYQTSMLGQYVVGIDIHKELYTAMQSVEHGWDLSWTSDYNTSWVLGFLTPLLARVGLDPIWQFKLLYPAVFAFVPVIMFLVYRKLLDDKKAFLASSLLFMSPTFYLETPTIVKTLVAQTFLALTLFFLVSDIPKAKKILGLIICITGAVTAHYTIAVIITSALLGCTALTTLVTRKVNLTLLTSTGTALVVLVAWFGTVGNGVMLENLKYTVKGVFVTATSPLYYKPPDATSSSSPVELYVTSDDPRQEILDRTQPTARGSYLDAQEPLVRTALGLDFNEASILGKIFRILQYSVQVLAIVGCFALWKTRKKLPLIYCMLEVVAVLLLLMCVFVPFFSATVSITRFYQIALMILAPVIVLGITLLFEKHWTIIVMVVIFPYFVFTSGLPFELSHNTTMSFVDTPYSFGLSNYRIDSVGVFNQEDRDTATYVSQMTRTLPVYMDYQSYTLTQGINEGYGMSGWTHSAKPPYILFLNSWNTTHNELVYGRNSGLRYYEPLPDLTNATEIFRRGDAVVYQVQ